MSISFSVSSNTPFTMSTSVNTPTLVSLHTHSFLPHSPLPAGFAAASAHPPTIHGMDVAQYHSLIHAELMHIQQQQDVNLHMQNMLHHQQMHAHHQHHQQHQHPHQQSSQHAHPSPSPVVPPRFSAPQPLAPHSLQLPVATSLASFRPPSHSAVGPSPAHSHSAFSPLPARPSPRHSSHVLPSYPAALTNALTSLPVTHPAAPQAASAPSSAASASPHLQYYSHPQQPSPQPFAPPSPFPLHPQHYSAMSHQHHPHPHTFIHPHAHLHARPLASHVPSVHRSVVLQPYPLIPYQPRFSVLPLPMPAHAHVPVQEDNKRAASAAAIQSLQRQLIERKQPASALTPSAADKAVHEEADDVSTCAVCLSDFEHGELSILMPCSHPYHEVCLLPWLAKQNSCPSCRYELMTDDEMYNRHVRIKQDRQRIETERRLQRISVGEVSESTTAAAAATAVAAVAAGLVSPPIAQAGQHAHAEAISMEEEAEEYDDEDEEDTMYDDSELDDEEDEEQDERAEQDRQADDEDDDEYSDYEDEGEVDDGSDSDVVEIQPPHRTTHNRANPIIIDADNDDYKQNDSSLASYPSIPSLPSTGTSLSAASAWSNHSFADVLPLSSVSAVPVASAVLCALCGEVCAGAAGAGVGGVLLMSCCGVMCHSACVHRRMFDRQYAAASGELTCPMCHLPAAFSSVQ